MNAFIAINPVAMLGGIHASLEQAGMLRSGDEGRHATLRSAIERRIASLPEELELNRYAPAVVDYCGGRPFVLCGGECVLVEVSRVRAAACTIRGERVDWRRGRGPR